MADLVNAFNDCVERLQRGETLGSCLRRYPEFANQLHPMLETTQLAGRVQVNPVEVAAATDRIRNRVAHAVYTTPVHQRRNPFSTVMVLAALVAVAFFGGYLAAQLLNESTEPSRPELSSSTSLNEVRQLVSDGQLAEVQFEGTVTLMQGTLWNVEDMLVTVPADTVLVGEPISEGSLVRVEGYTTPRRELFAMTITLLSNEDILPTSTPTMETAVPSITPETPSPTVTAELCFVTPSTGANVAIRSGGGVNYGLVGQLNVGESLPAIGINEANNTWYQVQYDAVTTGWVSSTVTTLTGDCENFQDVISPALPQQNTSVPTTPVPTVNSGSSNSGSSGPGGGDNGNIETPTEVEATDEPDIEVEDTDEPDTQFNEEETPEVTETDEPEVQETDEPEEDLP